MVWIPENIVGSCFVLSLQQNKHQVIHIFKSISAVYFQNKIAKLTFLSLLISLKIINHVSLTMNSVFFPPRFINV